MPNRPLPSAPPELPPQLVGLTRHTHVHRIIWRTRQLADRWQARVSAGRPDGAFPMWQADGPSEAEALANAAAMADHFYTETARASER